MLLILFFLPSRSNAQLPCFDVTNQCAGFDPAVWASFKCIEGPIKVSELISGTILLSQIDATTTLQRIVVKGTLTVDITTASGGYTFAEGSTIIFNDENSEIIVDPGCQLTLDKMKVSGCLTMWKNILVSEGARLNVKNGCEIYSGIEAIKALPNSSISITDNIFGANYIAIAIGSLANQQMPINFIPNGGIWGNQISGGNLKTPLPGQKSLVGIRIGGISDISIGKAGPNPNLISGLKNSFGPGTACNGISAFNSNITIRNTKFSDIASPADPVVNTALSGVQGSTIKLFGLGLTTNTIEFGNTGVYLSNSGAEISDVKFKDNTVDVHNTSSMSILRTLKIKDCIFDGFDKIGVEVIGGCRLSTFEVTKCVFDDNRDRIGNRKYIIVIPTTPIDGIGFKFSENKFYFRNRIAPFPNVIGASGVVLSNIHRGVGSDNEFYDEGTIVGLSRSFIGVTMEACLNFVWEGNDFLGSGSSIPQLDSETGFLVSNSPFCQYNCNFLDGFNTGMQFYGDCSTSSIYNNSFNSHSRYALDLTENGTVIGRQFKKYNQWNGSGAFKMFSSYNPFNANHKFQVQRSLFTIHTVNTNLPAWANPRKVENVDPDPNWFEGNNTWPPLVDLCPLIYKDPEEPKLDISEKALIEGNFLPYRGFASNTSDATFLLYQHMTEDSTLRPYASVEATWYANNYTSNIGKLWRVYNGYISLPSAAPTAAATQLLSDLNAIGAANTFEQNLRNALRIFLEKFIYESESFTSQQTSELISIANQCRYEGGVGVVLARLAIGQSSAKDGDCPLVFGRLEGGERSNQNVINFLNTTVFPNPAEQSFSIRLDRPIQNGTLRIINLQGQVIGNWTFSGDNLEISEANIVSGLYVLEVHEQGNTLSRTKLVFNH
jgi:hypothetical protein